MAPPCVSPESPLRREEPTHSAWSSRTTLVGATEQIPSVGVWPGSGRGHNFDVEVAGAGGAPEAQPEREVHLGTAGGGVVDELDEAGRVSEVSLARRRSGRRGPGRGLRVAGLAGTHQHLVVEAD